MARQEFAAVSPTPSSAGGGGGDETRTAELIVYVALPIIIAVCLAIVALLLLVIYLAMRTKAKRQQFTELSKEESRLHNLTNLPYPSVKPPAISMDPPSPDMTFAIAPQLPSPPTAQRYPFFKHKRQENKTIHGEEKRPPRLRTRRAGNHKHGKGMQTIFKDGGTGRGGGDGGDGRPVNEKERSSTTSESPPIDVSGDGVGGGVGGKRRVSSPAVIGDVGGVLESFTVLASQKQLSRTASTADRPPEIFLTLSYIKEKTTLIVTVQRVVGLPQREDGTGMDAYVRLYFVPRIPALAQRKTSKTRTRKSESDPIFDELIYYEAMSEDEMINSTLHVQVLDYRAYGRHPILGQGKVELFDVPLKEEEELVVLQLSAPKVRREGGGGEKGGEGAGSIYVEGEREEEREQAVYTWRGKGRNTV